MPEVNPRTAAEPRRCMNITKTHSCSEALPRRTRADSAAAPTRSSTERPTGLSETDGRIRDATQPTSRMSCSRTDRTGLLKRTGHAVSGLCQPRRRRRRRFTACRTMALLPTIRNRSNGGLRNLYDLRLQEVSFGQCLDHNERHILLLLLVTFLHRHAKPARMLSIKRRPHCLLYPRLLRTRNEHSRPRHRLQSKPMRTAHLEGANNS
jgi:hypothetical protein